ITSHCCGVFGLKPTFGVVPQRGYLDHVGGGHTDVDINVFGPIARSAEDLDLLLGVLAGADDQASLAWHLELPAPRRSASDLRVCVWLTDHDAPHDPDQLMLIETALATAADAGMSFERAHPPIER